MKLASPVGQVAEERPPVTARGSAEPLLTEVLTSTDRHALLAHVELITETDSVAETLELTARLLAEVGINVARLRLDRGGFIIEWKPSNPVSDVLAIRSARSDTTTLEVWCDASVFHSTERAVGAILRAAVIRAGRCSRCLWQLPADVETSAAGRKLEADIVRVARFPHGILITGETGTGKTIAARHIHKLSARSSRPFVELNCASLPEQLVEAELFGYRRGAFTGADRDHKGLFEEAHGGILFLDEIGDLPPAVQNKLLKAIEEKQIKRLGTNHYVECNVQVVAATSRNLSEMVRRGEFREDLYCRLAVLRLEVTPLRERRDDIPALVDHFLREAAREVERSTGRAEEYAIECGAVEMLCTHNWSGNIRQLRNAIYELTSYVTDGEPVRLENVQAVLAAPSALALNKADTAADARAPSTMEFDDEQLATRAISDALRSVAREGDIILPVEVCLLRRGETLKQWAARVKQLGIEATRSASGGTMRTAASRLGLSQSSLKSHLHRARHAPHEAKSNRAGVEL